MVLVIYGALRAVVQGTSDTATEAHTDFFVRYPPKGAYLAWSEGETVTNRLPNQPIERTLRIIGGRWKMAILFHLMAGDGPGPKRQSELMRLIPSVSQKVLIQQLREMEGHGLVTRTVHPVVPPHVDYAATSLAQSLAPIAEAMCAWGRQHADAIKDVR